MYIMQQYRDTALAERWYNRFRALLQENLTAFPAKYSLYDVEPWSKTKRAVVVVLPRGIQAVHFAAPCVEAPVDAAAFAFAVDDKGREAGHARCRTTPPSTERSCVRFKWFQSRAERLCVRHRRLTVTNRHVQTRSSGSLHAAQIPRAYKTRPARV